MQTVLLSLVEDSRTFPTQQSSSDSQNCHWTWAGGRVWPISSLCFGPIFQPIFLNEVLVKLPTDPSSDEPVFHISHIDRVYTLRTDNINERSVLTTCDLP